MNDIDTIDAAYSDAVKNLYNVLSTAFLMAEGDADKERVAKEAFKRGLDLARKVRDNAKVIVKM